MTTAWDEDGYEPDDGAQVDVNPDAPEVETAGEYGPVDLFTEDVQAPEDIPNGDAQ